MSEVRERFLERLKEDLVGPKFGEAELVPELPSERYLTGILWPQSTHIRQEDDDSLESQAAGGGAEDDADAEEVALFRSFRPSTCGISFAVSSQGSDPRIAVYPSFGTYRAEEKAEEVEERGDLREKRAELDQASEQIGDGDQGPGRKLDQQSQSTNKTRRRLAWRRFGSDLEAPLVLEIAPGERNIEIVPGLKLFQRVSKNADIFTVTIQFINDHIEVQDEEKSGEFPKGIIPVFGWREREEAAFFQFEAYVEPHLDCVLVPRPKAFHGNDEDQKISDLIYRDSHEFAVGHTCSASWKVIPEGGAERVELTWMPKTVVRKMDPAGDERISKAISGSPLGRLNPLELAFAETADLLASLGAIASGYDEWIEAQEKKVDQLSDDLSPQARENIKNCRLASARVKEGLEAIRSDPLVEKAFRLANRAIYVQAAWSQGYAKAHSFRVDDVETFDFTWRPFQMAFALSCLSSTAEPDHHERAIFDLIWFPTGGGKTEAYLLLAAFVLFLRRLRYSEAGGGVGAFMRYTLRTLTIQQFQRAASLITACECIRAQGDIALGDERFTIGLWVGSATTPNHFDAARKALSDPYAQSTPRQLLNCPACSSEVSWSANQDTGIVVCECKSAECSLPHDFGPIPVATVDDQIYDTPPSLLIGTIDKFAQIARNPNTRSLFGRGNERRPPDLIIQDELHLISGPLGSMAGLYESAIDLLCSSNGRPPKIVGSTATIRRASEQVKALFNRDVVQFPPPAIDASNSGFAVEMEPADEKSAGRLYVGLTTAGRSEKFAIQAASASLMQSGCSDSLGTMDERDPYATLVVYFNSLKVLSGALVLFEDDVHRTVSALAKQRDETERNYSLPEELNSRRDSSEIPEILKRLERPIGNAGAIDALLATNMLSVGVDINRLGLMLVNGQPKTVAEYIQATSRVGRKWPGLVVALYNNNKIRDRARYETFSSWHAAFYSGVEPTSVTPFSPRARDKALHVPLVALIRHLRSPTQVNPDRETVAEMYSLRDKIVARVAEVDSAEAKKAGEELDEFIELWIDRARSGQLKFYWSDNPRRYGKALMMSAEKAAARRAIGRGNGGVRPTPNSLRNVEPSVDFVLRERPYADEE